MSATTTSPRGVYALALHEGIVPGPYRDSVGVWTYGIGHTRQAGDPDPATLPRGMPHDLNAEIREVVALFRRDLARYEAAVRKAVKVPVAQHEFDALVSFHYNTGAIANAKLTGYLNTDQRKRAAGAFMNWVKPSELRPRRQSERALFETGLYPSGPITVWEVNDFGRVIWRSVLRLEMEAFLALMADAGAPAPSARPRLRIADLPLVRTPADVRRLQRLLEVDPDGAIGEKTYRALLARVQPDPGDRATP
jgi:lysozyme